MVSKRERTSDLNFRFQAGDAFVMSNGPKCCPAVYRVEREKVRSDSEIQLEVPTVLPTVSQHACGCWHQFIILKYFNMLLDPLVTASCGA